MKTITGSCVVLVVVCVLGAVSTTTLPPVKPGEVLRQRCRNKELNLAHPLLLTAPGTRVACALFVETSDGQKPFVIQVQDPLIKGTVKDLGWFDGEIKACPVPHDASKCMTIINHPYPQMDGAIQYYSNPTFDSEQAACESGPTPCPDPADRKYIGVMDCLEPGSENPEPGQLYIVFETSDFDATEIQEMEDFYNFSLNKTALDECIKIKDEIFPDPYAEIPRPTTTTTTTVAST